MADEAELLNALAAAPADDLLRQIYADWLDENPGPGRAAKAEFLRLEAEKADAGPQRTAAIDRRLAELARQLAPGWAAVAGKRPVENCSGPRFAFACPRTWQSLAPTDRPAVRRCDDCRREVFYCVTLDEAARRARQGHCVAVDVGQPRRPGDLLPPREEMLTVGRLIAPPTPSEKPSLFARLRRRIGL